MFSNAHICSPFHRKVENSKGLGRWLSNQRSYMTYSGFEKKLNKVIDDILNGHRQFNMYKMITNLGHMLEYNVLNMFLRYALQEGYHGVI